MADILAAAKKLLGKRVKITLGPNLTLTGKLRDVTEDGGVKIELDGEGVTHAWPMLAIEEVPDA